MGLTRAKKKWKPTKFPLPERRRVEVVAYLKLHQPPPILTALFPVPIQALGHKPYFLPGVEAETTIPKPPSVHKPSSANGLFLYPAALFTSPVKRSLCISSAFFFSWQPLILVAEPRIIIVKAAKGNNFFVQFARILRQILLRTHVQSPQSQNTHERPIISFRFVPSRISSRADIWWVGTLCSQLRCRKG